MERPEIGFHRLPDFENLTVDKIDTTVIGNTEEFLEVLRRYYIGKFRSANERRVATTERLKKQLKRPEDLIKLRAQHQNETVKDMVINDKSVDRIVEEDNRLIQKIYPIYILPESDHLFDFRTQFLVAYKPILGGHYDTFGFNVLVIWTMSFFLFVLLYFDVLGRIIRK